jgi:hypothetical protein
VLAVPPDDEGSVEGLDVDVVESRSRQERGDLIWRRVAKRARGVSWTFD